jgi:hypothetical protein
LIDKGPPVEIQDDNFRSGFRKLAEYLRSDIDSPEIGQTTDPDV